MDLNPETLQNTVTVTGVHTNAAKMLHLHPLSKCFKLYTLANMTHLKKCLNYLLPSHFYIKLIQLFNLGMLTIWNLLFGIFSDHQNENYLL